MFNGLVKKVLFPTIAAAVLITSACRDPVEDVTKEVAGQNIDLDELREIAQDPSGYAKNSLKQQGNTVENKDVKQERGLGWYLLQQNEINATKLAQKNWEEYMPNPFLVTNSEEVYAMGRELNANITACGFANYTISSNIPRGEDGNIALMLLQFRNAEETSRYVHSKIGDNFIKYNCEAPFGFVADNVLCLFVEVEDPQEKNNDLYFWFSDKPEKTKELRAKNITLDLNVPKGIIRYQQRIGGAPIKNLYRDFTEAFEKLKEDVQKYDP